MWSALTIGLIDAALREDLGDTGDITSALLPDAHAPFQARLIAREAGVIAGLALAPLLCEHAAERLGALRFELALVNGSERADGAAVCGGEVLGVLRGTRAGVLGLERTLLNFLGRVCGVATLTRRFVEAAHAANPAVRVLDTRKTLPGWRELDKYAVRCGGGENHRSGLYDAVLLKDNHLAGVPLEQLAAHVAQLAARARATGLRSAPTFVEVEVDSLAQLEQLCAAPGVDIVLLDNFSLDMLRAAVKMRDDRGLRHRLLLECSGGVTLATIGAYAATGVERISVGALTHAAPALDLALDA